jgi:hypothetical protein
MRWLGTMVGHVLLKKLSFMLLVVFVLLDYLKLCPAVGHTSSTLLGVSFADDAFT